NRSFCIIFIAEIQNITREVEEAALLDRATGFKKLKYITLPMGWTTVKIAIILAVSGSLKAFDQIYIMTVGVPSQSTELMATYMYNNTFMVYRYGYGSAISTLIIIFSLILIGISQLVTKRKNDDAG